MHGMGLHPGSPAFLQAYNFMMFSGELTPFPQRHNWKRHPCSMVSFYKDVFPSQVQIPKGHGGKLLGWFFFESDFAKDEIKKKLGLSLFSQVKQRLIVPSTFFREIGL